LVLLFACSHGDAGEVQRTSAKSGTSRVVFAMTEQNIGLISKDSASAVFPFKNEGTAELYMIPSRCGIRFWPSEGVPPGQSAMVFIDIPLSGADGDVTQEIPIGTNDPAHTSGINDPAHVMPNPIVLKVSAHVELPARFVPASLDFGELRRGESATRRVAIVGPLGGRAMLGAFEAPNKHLNVTARRVGSSASPEVEVVVSVPRDAPVGRRLGGALRIPLVGAEVPAELNGTVELTVVVPTTLVLEPARELLTAQVAADGTVTIPEFVVKSRRGAAFKILSIKDSANLITARAEPQGVGLVKVRAALEHVPSAPIVRGTLILTTDDPESPELKQPYMVDRAR
jgi:hypothetical protein